MTSRASAFCAALGIRYPIVQSGMSRVAGPELVAAVCNAGGLGILAALRLEPNALRAQIRQIRDMTDAPFGVNLWLHPAVVSPIAPETIDANTRRGATERLNEIRSRVGLAAADVNPSRFPNSSPPTSTSSSTNASPCGASASAIPEAKWWRDVTIAACA
jgi:NAD(P)H-dependent flavin oxidoreductase YrpB (nitropropane dioxygenase family)